MTLIELIIAVALMLVVMVGVFKALKVANTSANALSEMSQQESDSRRVVDVLVSDVRMAWTGTSTLTRFAPGFDGCTMTFYAPTRSVPAKLRRISYSMVAGTTDLMRSETLSNNTAAPWVFPAAPTPIKVLGGVHNVPLPSTSGCSAAKPIFTYWDKLDVGITLPGSANDTVVVKRVELDLTVDRIVGKFPDPDVFATSVELRSQ